jgi:parallel beta-helix repeat protein
MHGHHLRRKIEDLLSLDSVCVDLVWFPETAKILYECAVHLSANHQQEEAKRTLNFAYRILDWLPLAGYERIEKYVSDNLLFPLPIPIPQLFQTKIQQFSIPNLEPLTEKPALVASNLDPDPSDFVPEAGDLASDGSVLAPDASDLSPAGDLAPEPSDPAPDGSDFVSDASDLVPESSDLVPEAGDLAPDGSDLAPDGSDLAPDASDFAHDGSDLARVASDLNLDASSSAINLAQGCNKHFYALLFTKRSMEEFTVEEWENALKNANDYITCFPYSWEGYALKALALVVLNKEVSADLNDNVNAEIAAALAFYHNRDIFAKFPVFVESFLGLQRRIFICDSVDELLDAMFSQEVETGLLKILVLGSEKYILNYSENVDKPWNNCILVGTRKKSCVSLKSNYVISLLTCMLTNLSFSFNESNLHCLPESFVKILNCNFDGDDLVPIDIEGVFNAEQCSFTRSPLVCSKQSRAVVHDCTFCNNAKDGLLVNKGGSLKVENSRIYNNGCNGLYVYDSECVAGNCDIHDNGNDGIFIGRSEYVTLIRNNVYNNNMDGIYMADSLVDIKENKLFDNGTWGITGEGNAPCNISMNQIFRNKSGGVKIRCETEVTRLSPPVVKLNKIYHNGGPGLLVDGKIIKVAESQYLNSSNSFQSAEFQNNEMCHNKNNENDSKLNLSVPYCSYCRVQWKLTMCEKCFTTAYCSESCKKQHYSKHKEICKVLREKSSYLITSTGEPDEEDMVVDDPERYPGEDDYSEEVDPQLASPPRDDMRFVVKVHYSVTALETPDRIILYRRNYKHTVSFNSKVIEQLLKEFGVLCRQRSSEKKLFFHCLCEDNGQLRLFTNEFAVFQKW